LPRNEYDSYKADLDIAVSEYESQKIAADNRKAENEELLNSLLNEAASLKMDIKIKESSILALQ
jgi:hypothetical protein